MVSREGDFFKCQECEMIFVEKELAEEFENWCEKNQSCHLGIIRNAEHSLL